MSHLLPDVVMTYPNIEEALSPPSLNDKTVAYNIIHDEM